MADVGVFQGFEESLRFPARNFIDSASTSLAANLSAPLRSMLLLMVVWHGYQILRGESQEPIRDLIVKLMKGAVIVFLVTNVANYKSFVTALFMDDLPNQFAQGLGFGDVNAGRFDAILKGAQVYATRVYQAAGYTEMIKAAFYAAMVYLVMGLMAAQGYFTFLYSEFATALLLGIGPIFVCCALFDKTRPFFEGWLRQIANYIVLKLLGLAVLAFMLRTFDILFNPSSIVDLETGVIAVITTGFFCTAILFHLPAIATGIAGGSWFPEQKTPATATRVGWNAARERINRGRGTGGGSTAGGQRTRSASASPQQQQQQQQHQQQANRD
jgi:type IV secretion system protein VirB6